jgi:two-component system, cell cycle sensor histidine kinase and response regulator CckA
VDNKCKVLVVEDEGLIAHDISTRLEALGHEVVGTVSTAEEALDLASAADIVLMDIRIDGPIDGIEAATRLRDQCHLPVVFLTAHADRQTLDRAKLTGAFGYLVKPITHASLNGAIEIALYKHRIERKLEEREALLRTTLGSTADAVMVTDHLSRVLMLNAAAENLTGWTHAEAEGQPILRVLRLVDAESGEPAEDPVPLAILKDAVMPLDKSCLLVSRSGVQMMIEGSAAPVKASGIELGTVLTFRDVSARLWEEKQLRQAQKVDAAGRMAARVSDEFSSLLAIIRTQSEHLLQQFGEYSPARRAIEQIQESAAAAESLTRRLTRFGTRQATEQPELLSINGLLRRMSKLIESVAGARIEVSMRLSPLAGQVKVDAAQLEQAIMNLVLHACAMMPEGGELLIETGKTGLPRLDSIANYATLNIAHTGQEPDLEKLFEPASIAEDGLALAMVHGTVAEHSGYISAQPTSAGYRFEILLPLAVEALLPDANLEPGTVASVLLVDYRERMREQLHNFFEAEGYNLLEAVDDQEALALGEVHEGSLDLLVAEAADADRIGDALRIGHPGLHVLRIVDQLETAHNEIRRPFTQTALLQKASQLLGTRTALRAAATTSSLSA